MLSPRDSRPGPGTGSVRPAWGHPETQDWRPRPRPRPAGSESAFWRVPRRVKALLVNRSCVNSLNLHDPMAQAPVTDGPGPRCRVLETGAEALTGRVARQARLARHTRTPTRDGSAWPTDRPPTCETAVRGGESRAATPLHSATTGGWGRKVSKDSGVYVQSLQRPESISEKLSDSREPAAASGRRGSASGRRGSAAGGRTSAAGAPPHTPACNL